MNLLPRFRSLPLTLQSIALASLLGAILTMAIYGHGERLALCAAFGALLATACSFGLPRLAILLSVVTLGILTPLMEQLSIPSWLWIIISALLHLSLINQLIKSHG